MWFVDVVVDLPWFVETKGKLGEPRARASQNVPCTDIQNEFLIYGNDHAIRHLRVMLHTESEEPPRELVNENIHRWVNLLEVASGLTAPQTASTASLGKNTSAMIVFMARGDETTDSCQLDPQYASPEEVNYQAAAKLMAGWTPDFRVHLFYLGRFLNHELPPEVRWLNGYRALEWHFCRGKGQLSKKRAYLRFLAQHGHAFDPLLGPQQDRKGLIEEVRALAAHASLSRTKDPRNENASTNLINKTFAASALESLIVVLLNEGVVEGVTFTPKMPVGPICQADSAIGA
jgi:hypothetical protein